MSEEQLNEDMIKIKEGSFGAYGKLRRIRWTVESVDVYANNAKRLVGYIGRGLDKAAKLAFQMTCGIATNIWCWEDGSQWIGTDCRSLEQ